MYLIEFTDGEEGSARQFENVLAIDEYEAIDSIMIGWPEAHIVEVYVALSGSWQDEDNNAE